MENLRYFINIRQWIKAIALLAVLAFSIGRPVFASNVVPVMDGETQYASVLLDGVPISFKSVPIILNGTVYVPSEDLFNALGIQYYWFESTGELVGYRDNTYVKFKLFSNLMSVNGKSQVIEAPVSKRDSEIFIPLNDIANAFELSYDFDETAHIISLDFRENIYQYKQIGFRQFKKINTPNWGISYFVPEYWEPLDENSSSYGVKNDFEIYVITPQVLPLDASFNRNILMDELIKNKRYKYGSTVSFKNSTSTDYNDFQCLQTPYTFKENGMTFNGYIYVFFENNVGYVFDCYYDTINSRNEGQSIFESVMDTFQISRITLDYNSEHYIEFNKYFEYGTTLTSEAYSNMLADQQFTWSGKVAFNDSNNLKGFHIVVTREDEAIQYYVPLIANSFNAEVPLPFGVGKHNISIYVDEADDVLPTIDGSSLTLDEYLDEYIIEEYQLDISSLLMQFSVVNTSDEEIKYLLPSAYINYDENDVYTVANSITYDKTSEYAKARAIYQWIVENYTYAEEKTQSEISTAWSMLSKREGNVFELTLVYAGLLRAVDIPARIVKGATEDDSHYWVEVLLNGKWIIADVSYEIKYRSDNSVLSPGVYFDINSSIVYNRYDSTEMLPF